LTISEEGRVFNRKSVYIIGAGQLGSRHLQALKFVKVPLKICVIDPNPESLKTAQSRYDSIESTEIQHEIAYSNSIPKAGDEVDLAIIATNSDVRSQVIKTLLKSKKVNYLILEKLLFNKKKDYGEIQKLLNSVNCTAWVNCSMRKIPFYRKIKEYFDNGPILYMVTGSRYGLVTNLIHYVDHMAYLLKSEDFSVHTAGLDPSPIESKRAGFLELNGTCTVRFSDGSQGVFLCYPSGNLPVQVEIQSDKARCISREWQGKAWISRVDADWDWEEVDAAIPFQSQMTTELVEEILSDGSCPLVTYERSMRIHVTLLEGLLKFLKKESGFRFDHYPFT
jgi:predicted dehydrogenase